MSAIEPRVRVADSHHLILALVAMMIGLPMGLGALVIAAGWTAVVLLAADLSFTAFAWARARRGSVQAFVLLGWSLGAFVGMCGALLLGVGTMLPLPELIVW